MSIAETPIATIRDGRPATGDGVHLVARRYKKGVRLDTHMHREAQLVYAARGTMQVTTPKGRWLVPPDRAVWVPARLRTCHRRAGGYRDAHAVFRCGVAGARSTAATSLDAEFVVRVSRLLHEAILALFDGRNDPDRTGLLVRLAMLELHHGRGLRDLHSAAA